MTATTNPDNLRQYEIKFSVLAEQILAFTSHPNMFREVQNLPPNLKENCVMMFYVTEYFHFDS